MGSPGPPQDVTIDDVRGFFSHSATPSTPFFTTEVAEVLECPRQTARRYLEALVDRGEIQTKHRDDSNRIWWKPNGHLSDGHRPDEKQFRAFVSAVKDYAIFMLDREGRIVSWNEGGQADQGIPGRRNHRQTLLHVLYRQ